MIVRHLYIASKGFTSKRHRNKYDSEVSEDRRNHNEVCILMENSQ